MRYKATERQWVMRLLARLTPDQRRRYEDAMRTAQGYGHNNRKYDDLKARVAERILYEDAMKRVGK